MVADPTTCTSGSTTTGLTMVTRIAVREPSDSALTRSWTSSATSSRMNLVHGETRTFRATPSASSTAGSLVHRDICHSCAGRWIWQTHYRLMRNGRKCMNIGQNGAVPHSFRRAIMRDLFLEVCEGGRHVDCSSLAQRSRLVQTYTN
jgi:hypothetical protein